MVVIVAIYDYITKKFPRRLNIVLRRLQARYQLIKKRRISEGKLMELALRVAEHHEKELLGVEKKGSILGIIGKDKSKIRTNSVKELDSVVYSV
ncbi:hypothetical protein HY570_01065 [Candidatus Micrarchaeota archaeon]|nr:hypothetical protein [Candidatus Micrarchaeota archaeon]